MNERDTIIRKIVLKKQALCLTGKPAIFDEIEDLCFKLELTKWRAIFEDRLERGGQVDGRIVKAIEFFLRV